MNSKKRIAVICENKDFFEYISASIDIDNQEIIFFSLGEYLQKSNEKEFDIYVFHLSQAITNKGNMLNNKEFTFPRNTICIAQQASPELRNLAFKRGTADFIAETVARNSINIRIKRLMINNISYSKDLLNEKSFLDFLNFIKDKNSTSIEPIVDPLFPRGYFYPDVGEFFDRTIVSGWEFLEEIVEKGLLTRRIENKVRLCPECFSHNINFREVCPTCSRRDMQKDTVIHHFHCGHMNSLSNYKKNKNLICPKCDIELRHIGLDYERIADSYICIGDTCGEVFSDPSVEAQCLWCGSVCQPHETIEQVIWKYDFNEFTYQALKEKCIESTNLKEVLQNKDTGLFSRQFFTLEINREIRRSKRYGQVFSVLFLHVDNYAEVAARHSTSIDIYIDTIFEAACKGLRDLDTPCAIDKNVIGILMPETSEENAILAANRIKGNIDGLEHIYHIDKPEIRTNIFSNKDNFENSKNIIDAALQELAVG